MQMMPGIALLFNNLSITSALHKSFKNDILNGFRERLRRFLPFLITKNSGNSWLIYFKRLIFSRLNGIPCPKTFP